VLLALKLDNVALIDALDLEFSPGLTVLTGETGAGKSLLLDSLDVLLGAEIPRHLLRHGQDQARIEGRFAPHGGGLASAGAAGPWSLGAAAVGTGGDPPTVSSWRTDQQSRTH